MTCFIVYKNSDKLECNKLLEENLKLRENNLFRHIKGVRHMKVQKSLAK